jgi:hypothetical protein
MFRSLRVCEFPRLLFSEYGNRVAVFYSLGDHFAQIQTSGGICLFEWNQRAISKSPGRLPGASAQLRCLPEALLALGQFQPHRKQVIPTSVPG